MAEEVPGLADERRHHAVGEQRPGHHPGGGDRGVQAAGHLGQRHHEHGEEQLVASRPDSDTHSTHHWYRGLRRAPPPSASQAAPNSTADGPTSSSDRRRPTAGVARSSGGVGPCAAHSRARSVTAARCGRPCPLSRERQPTEPGSSAWRAPRRSSGRSSRGSSVIVQGWNSRTWPPWTKRTRPVNGQPSVAR